ncbi:MAG: hypothetical protein OEY14_08690, partial [Myxococcales bacterium]|nr:hypothetical protein [Myxococcales bacterium]
FASHGLEGTPEEGERPSPRGDAPGWSDAAAMDAASARPSPAMPEEDGGAVDPADAGMPWEDGGVVDPADAGITIIEPAPDRCARLFEGGEALECDPSTFEPCERAIDGVSCCVRTLECLEGRVVDGVICDDSCAQSCERIVEAGDCRAFGCEYFLSEACGPAGPGVIGSGSCVSPRLGPCNFPSQCASGICQPFLIEACGPDSDCDACAMVQGFCL